MFIELLNIFIEILLPAFAVIGLAAALDKKLNIDPRLLSKLNIYLLFPFFTILNLSSIEIDKDEMGAIIFMAIASTALLLIIAIFLAALLKLRQGLKASFIICIFYGNTAALGFTLAGFAFGVEGLQRAVLFYAVTQLIVNPLAIFIASRGTLSVGESFLNIFKNPIIYSICLGLALNFMEWRLILPLERFMNIFAQAMIPTQLVLLGFHLARISLKKNIGKVFVASFVRLIIAPVIGIILAFIAGIQGLAMQSSLMQISMPTGLFVTVYATEFGSDAEFASMVGMITTIGSIFTLSLLLYYI